MSLSDPVSSSTKIRSSIYPSSPDKARIPPDIQNPLYHLQALCEWGDNPGRFSAIKILTDWNSMEKFNEMQVTSDILWRLNKFHRFVSQIFVFLNLQVPEAIISFDGGFCAFAFFSLGEIPSSKKLKQPLLKMHSGKNLHGSKRVQILHTIKKKKILPKAQLHFFQLTLHSRSPPKKNMFRVFG